jgi:hypothetical protein
VSRTLEEIISDLIDAKIYHAKLTDSELRWRAAQRVDRIKKELVVTMMTQAKKETAMSDSDLAIRAVRGLVRLGEFHYPEDYDGDGHCLDCSLAGRVMQVFGVGMTRATELCLAAGCDPDQREEYDQDESEENDE